MIDITKAIENYKAMQTAKEELILAAVDEIAELLEGLEWDICKEILETVYYELRG
jgi:hypothetical protein